MKIEIIIVLITRGKLDSVDNVKVVLFNNLLMAKEYCRKTTDCPKGEKYWTFAEIIKDGQDYEMYRYENAT